jgi:ppGpp synthetase/RelA/SpoT-type nucleotidyltranferase
MNIDNLLGEYNQRLPLYDAFRKRLQSVIHDITQDDQRVLSITSRIKSLDSIAENMKGSLRHQ